MLFSYCCKILLPPDVVLVMAQAASFLVLNSALLSISINTGNTLASITAWICCLFPAVILDIVQHASFRMLSLVADKRWRRHGRTEQLRITWVCISSPVTMFPTALKAADTTLCCCCIKSSTNLRLTPESITACIFSFGPSDK